MAERLTAVEALRRRYRPDDIRTLFVGESAPAGGSFFYDGNSQMYRYFRRAFGQPPDFLAYFMERGCYLDDLVLEPINNQTRRERLRAHRNAIPSMAWRISEYAPLAVVSCLYLIDEPVRDAVSLAGSQARYYVVPFPGNGQQKRFLREMSTLIPELP